MSRIASARRAVSALFAACLAAPGIAAAQPTAEAPQPPLPVIAVVIDDLGEQGAASRRALRLPAQVGMAFLPHGAHTPEQSRAASLRGHEVLLHMPMEPLHVPPAVGALRVDDDPSHIEATLDQALARVHGVVGVNNHQGSRFTAAPAAMDRFLAAVARRGGLYFIDSRTTAHSMGYALARHHDIPAARRQVFLDNDPSPAAVRAAWTQLIAIARRNGRAMAIGHPYPSTLDWLEEVLPRLSEYGVTLVPPSALLTQPQLPHGTTSAEAPGLSPPVALRAAPASKAMPQQGPAARPPTLRPEY